MKIGAQLPLREDKQNAQSLLQWMYQFLQKIRQHVDGGDLGFGDGVDADNIAGAWYTYTTNAVANTEDAIAHNLGVVPIGWLVITQDKAGTLYKGTTAWTATQMFLKCDVASMQVRIFVLRSSSTAY